ncbi:MAG: internalin, putative [uncultured Cytophagales bacterium]|uniref:Internalin, putative n=1 Tax=uncultured Cytophagales bacterium TaxID=158755 RepID=A0A6J4I9K9_9SPHI|nr:MAG: internalin, putative [uncultured Cytophagales bacterium]
MVRLHYRQHPLTAPAFRRIVLVYLLLPLLPGYVSAQTVSVSVKIDTLQWYGIGDPDDSAEPRINFSTDQGGLMGRCFELSGSKNGSRTFDRHSGRLNSFTVDWRDPTFNLHMDGFEKDKQNSNECLFNPAGADRDDHHETGSVAIDLRKLVTPAGQPLPPGVSSEKQYVATAGTKYVAHFTVRYWMTGTPAQPTKVIPPDANVCGQETVTLKTGVNLAYKPGLQYVWEYHHPGQSTYEDAPGLRGCLEDCFYSDPDTTSNCRDLCYTKHPAVEVETWTQLAVTDTETLSFHPVRAIFGPTLTANRSVEFRVKVKTAEVETPWSTLNTLHFSPAAPDLSRVTVTYDKACPGQANGVVHVGGLSGVGHYLYVLRAGHYNTQTCNPDAGDCLTGFTSGTAYQNRFDIAHVKAGEYTLWIANPGGNLGVCYSTVNVITVPEYPRLVPGTPVVVPADCHGKMTGSITVSASGGTYPIACQLSGGTLGQPLAQPSATPGTPFAFTGLGAGAYLLTMTDGCGQTETQTITITQPGRVTVESPGVTHATCEDPGNGKLLVQATAASGPFDNPFSGTYAFRLFKDGVIYRELASTSDPSWPVTDLPVCNDYQLLVKDATESWCSSDTFRFAILAPARLSVATVQTTHVSCYGGGNGQIRVTGNGLPDQTEGYLYSLKRGTELVGQNQEGVFDSLAAGTYTVTKRRNITGCTDAFTAPPITIHQPPVLSISYAKTDVTCYGQHNGRITALVAGGTPPYAYRWQVLLAGTWADMSNRNSLVIENLAPGSYRLQVSDSGACPVLPPSVTVIEPSLLRITEVKRHDMVCLGGKGSLEPAAAGGTRPYTFGYSTDGGKSYTPFTAATRLDAGTYGVRVIDRNGCEAVYDSTLTITAPPAPVSFTYTLSDYNGYQVSCYGGNNGTATILAAGGNGTGYTGHTYAVDNGAFGSNSTLTGIAAGTHTLHVKDARGCVASQPVAFTQPEAALFLALSSKTDILCDGEATGELGVRVTGGTAPYRFSRDGVAFQPSAQFTGLPAGNYLITVQDRNGCSTTLPVSLIHLHPLLRITAAVTHVSCYDGSDGQVEVSASGGAGGYRYAWTTLQQTGALVSGLKTGTYPLTVTDGAGCRKDTSFAVGQPAAPLGVYVHNTPVCADRTHGIIKPTARGGTPPYRHSIDNGVSFGESDRFLVGVGTYPVVVQDSKGCEVSTSTTIVQRNDRPQPNFLVASRRNVLDTLVIKETSLPKADSVHWTFDPRAVLVDADAYAPKIRFAQPGTYLVTMTGYFGGCDYSLTKTLTLTPVDPPAAAPPTGTTAIRELTVTPNPNDGRFSFTVRLSQVMPLSVVVVDVLGNEYYRKSWEQAGEVTQRLQLDKAASGFYILKAIVPTDAKETRVLLHKQ